MQRNGHLYLGETLILHSQFILIGMLVFGAVMVRILTR